MQEVKETVKKAINQLFGIDFNPELTRTEEQFGDYSTNAAMQLAKNLVGSPSGGPRGIAELLKAEIDNLGYYKKVEVAGPGFLNITLKDNDIWNMAKNSAVLPQPLNGQEILVEFGDPNPFKEMHIGHLYSYIVGDSISRLFEANGATVRRLSYHGDVGLHVARAIYAMKKEGLDPDRMPGDTIAHIGKYYAAGVKDSEDDPEAKSEIEKINEHVYKKDDPLINKLYEWGKSESFREFDAVLKDLKISIDEKGRYLENESASIGTKYVKENLGRVFKESDGAIIYEGEKIGLHTRVFITSKGLPTYETKDLGLAELKNQDYPNASRSIIITANEQSEYFKVMLAALKEFDPELASKTTHLSHGFLSLSTGKMSSRTGNVYSAIKLIVDVEEQVKKLPASTVGTQNAAIKYGFLKHRLGGDIVYDIAESVSVEGNSGPYLQYAYARAIGILQKVKSSDDITDLDEQERSLARKVSEYPEVVARATEELMPHYIATYLYELAQAFNRFYEYNRVLGDPREAVRANLVKAYANTLKSGLSLLNIEAPERV
jgi:arginyl-tRNA synthetase